MSGWITRQEMADTMVSLYNADISEPAYHNWGRANTTVMTQGDGLVEGEGLDFHMLELCLNGKHHMRSESEFERGDRDQSILQPGKMSYVQRRAPMYQIVEGCVELQHVYISHTIFEDCASSLFKGDPDKVVSLGFQAIFEPRLKALAETLLDEARRPAIGSDLTADLIAQQIAVLILRRQNTDRLVEQKDRRLSDAETARVIAYLDDQIEDIGGMDTLAALIDMDVFSFTKAFKATTGESPGQFLIQRRLARVKELLRTTNNSLADITYATGFSNQPHMTSTFTKHVGVSPGKWRKAVRG
ncbi:AraC family transcriptional regulator [uncultured Tateyamaria sp.]|uniref:helix-turn-helix domain-containing protein n=1 Tax=uncultured Tateyamaria sp. TaxID=455651 RepID=UPI00262106F5|nr:AraC family transcriptional regulator [uncultured Tateyamaria sp.]